MKKLIYGNLPNSFPSRPALDFLLARYPGIVQMVANSLLTTDKASLQSFIQYEGYTCIISFDVERQADRSLRYDKYRFRVSKKAPPPSEQYPIDNE